MINNRKIELPIKDYEKEERIKEITESIGAIIRLENEGEKQFAIVEPYCNKTKEPEIINEVEEETKNDGKFKKGNKFHRPLKFGSVQELEDSIENYFNECDDTIVKRVRNKQGDLIYEITKPYSITGLAYYLKTSRQTLINYEEKEPYFDTIKNAKARIEASYEERALLGDNNPTVSIFTLKNNFDWKDRSEVATDNINKVEVEIISSNKDVNPENKINEDNDADERQQDENND